MKILIGILIGFLGALGYGWISLSRKTKALQAEMASEEIKTEKEIREEEQERLGREIDCIAQTLGENPGACIALQLVANDMMKKQPFMEPEELKKYLSASLFAYYSLRKKREALLDKNSSGATH